MSLESERHSFYLNRLVAHPNLMGIKKQDIRSIISEPVWLDRGSYKSLCDLVLVMYDYTTIVGELKQSYHQRQKAKYQLRYGKQYSESVLGMSCRYGLFLVYQNPEQIFWEIIK